MEDEAKIILNIETNEKLDEIGKNTEASLLAQDETKEAVKEHVPILEAIMVNTEPKEVQKVKIEIEDEEKDELASAFFSMLKGKKGDKPTDEELIALIKPLIPSENDLTAIIEPLIPEPIKGEDGEDYILTKEDKNEIAKLVEVPVVEKVIEKTETIIEKPITIDKTRTVVKEVAKYEEASDIAEKLNTLSKKIDFKVIKNFPDFNKGGSGLNTVFTDGVTVFGNGLADDPLRAAASPDLSGYVPYTGATNDVDLGTHTLTSGPIDITGVTTTATLGSEMIINAADGDFSSNTGNWTGTNWTIGGGVATHTAGANNFTLDNSALSAAPVAGQNYRIRYSINTTVAGTTGVRMQFGGTSAPAYIGKSTGSVTSVFIITATDTTPLTFVVGDATWTGTLDNVEVSLLTQSEPVEIIRNSDNTVGNELRAGGTGSSNTFIGYQSGRSNTSGSTNTAFGYQALKNNTTGSRNMALGYQSLQNNTSGSDNVAIGFQSLTSITNGNLNFGIGSYCLGSLTSGGANYALGHLSMFNTTTGGYNVGFGQEALRTNTTGSNNVAFGFGAGKNFTVGAYSNNIFIGYQAANNITTGADNNIVIGYDIDLPTAGGSNQMTIGNLIYATGLGATGTTVSTGNLGISTKTPVSKLHIGVAPTASANYGLVSLGSGAFDGSTSGYFTGNASGTGIAMNLASGYGGDLMNLQIAGVPKFTVYGGSYNTTVVRNISGFNGNTPSETKQFQMGVNSTIDGYEGRIYLSSYSGTGPGLYVDGTSGSVGSIGIYPPGGNKNYYQHVIRPQANVTATTGAVGLTSIEGTFAAGAGSATFRPLNLAYTINNSGAQSGIATGIFLNATETALNSMTHNLMDLQVGGSSKFKVENDGTGTFAGSLWSGQIISSSNIYAAQANSVGILNRVRLWGGSASGIAYLTNSAADDFTLLGFGGTTSSFPALKKNLTGLQPRLADDSNPARWLQGQGADVASATIIALGSGNSFELTGTTSVTLITSTGWTEGAIITLIANESVTITNGTSTSGADTTIKLAGASDFNMTADDTLTLILSSTTAGGVAWREVCRSVN